MSITVSKLRENIHKIIGEILATGRRLEVTRRGRKLRIIPESGEGKSRNLMKHDCLTGPPDDIVHMDWSDERQI